MKRIDEEANDVGGGITLAPDSVDTQIDSLLVSFEEESMEVDEDAIVPEGMSIRKMLVILEQEDDQGEKASAKDEEEVTSNKEPNEPDPAEPLTPKMNIDEFAERVAMLVETYTRRLDVETVIFNRARNYVEEEHGADAAREFEEILVSEHDIDLRDRPMEAEDSPQPHAVGAMGPSL